MFTLLPVNPFVRTDEDGRVPAGLLRDPQDEGWAWKRWGLVRMGPAVAACDALAEHADHGCALVFAHGDPLRLEHPLYDQAQELTLGDRGDRAEEPELRAQILDPDQGLAAERRHALLVSRAWVSEPDERDRLLALGAAEAFVREHRRTGYEQARYRDDLGEGTELRRETYRRVVDGLRERGELFAHLRPACRLAFRELGADDEGTERLAGHLATLLCDRARPRPERGQALDLLARHWPGRHRALRDDGRLAIEVLPGWEAWDRARFQHPLKLLLAASQDPERLAGLLANDAQPAGCQLSPDDPLPKDRWAVEAAAGVAAAQTALEPELASRYEPLLRQRFLSRPPTPRHGPRRLLSAHRELVGLCEPEDGMRASLEVIERALELSDWEGVGGATYLRLWWDRWDSGPALAQTFLRWVRDDARAPSQRLAARQALSDLCRDLPRKRAGELDEFAQAANATLIDALRAAASDHDLRAALEADLDRWLSPEEVDALRAEGLLAAQTLPPYPEVPGATTGNGNVLYPALDDLARKVDLEDLLRELDRLPARQSADDMARGVTALALAPRLQKRYDDVGPRLERALRPLLGDERAVTHGRRAWHLDQEALKAYLELLPGLLKAAPDDLGALARGALAGLLRRSRLPETHYSKHGPYGAAAITQALRRALRPEEAADLAGWLSERMLDRGLSAYARLNARHGVEGLRQDGLLEAADRRLLAVLAASDEDAELRAKAHSVLAPRFPREVYALQEDGLLPSLALPAIESLHEPVPGGCMRVEPWVSEAAHRQHPERLLEAIGDPELGLAELCAALLFVPSSAARGAEPEQVAAALRGRLVDRRIHEAGGGRWCVARLAAEVDVARCKGATERTDWILAGLDAALRAEAEHTVRLYAPAADAAEASRAKRAFGLYVARHYAVALKDAKTRGAALDALEGIVRDGERSGAERLAALDALSQLIKSAPKKDRPAEEARWSACVACLAEAKLVRAGALDGLHLAVDWKQLGLPQRFAWIG